MEAMQADRGRKLRGCMPFKFALSLPVPHVASADAAPDVGKSPLMPPRRSIGRWKG